MLRRIAVAVSLVALFATGCGDDEPTSAERSAEGSDPDAAASGSDDTSDGDDGGSGDDDIDLSDVDACSLLDDSTVQDLTAETEDFVADGSSGVSCFWGVPRAGFPAYVELSVHRSTGGLAAFDYNIGTHCSEAAIAGVGDEALGGTCPPNPQTKVYVVAFERGAIVTLLLNEPNEARTPDDLAPVVKAIFAKL